MPSTRTSRGLVNRSNRWVKTLLKQGFALAVDRHWLGDYPIGKYVPWLEPDGSFSEQNLLQRIASEAQKIVELGPEIAETLHAISAESRKKTVRSSQEEFKGRARKPS